MTDMNLPAKSDSTVRGLFMRPDIQQQITRALPSVLSAEKLTRVMLTLFRTNTKLLECSQKSLLACFFGCAQLGLTPEPWLGQAYLVPFWNRHIGPRGGYEAVLIPGYRGFITLANRSGQVLSVMAAAVYEKEVFQFNRFQPELTTHSYADGDPGELKGAYTVWRHKAGFFTGEFLPMWEVDAIMERSKSRDRDGKLVGPWITDKPEMAKKSAIRRHFKLAPVSVEDVRLARAVEVENIALNSGPGAATQFLYPDTGPIEPQYTADDFEKEFADLADHKHWKSYFNACLEHHGKTQGWTEGDLKLDFVRSAPEVRRGFNKWCDQMDAEKKDAERKEADRGGKKQDDDKSAAAGKKAEAGKKAPAKKAADKKAAEKANADQEFEALLQSDTWQEMSALKAQNEKLYKKITEGIDPRNIEQCEALVDAMTAALDVGDMPSD